MVVHVLALMRQLLLVHIVDPNTLDDLEDLVADIELVVELRVGTSGLAFDIELHQRMQEVVVGEL